MKHRLALVLLAPLLAACGDASHGDGASHHPPAPMGYRLIALVSAPDGGGTPTTSLTWLRDDDDASQYAAQFRPDLQGKLHEAFAAPAVPAGGALFAAVVAVGCDVPTHVTALTGVNGPMVTAAPVPSPKATCFAPITTVAVVSGPVP